MADPHDEILDASLPASRRIFLRGVAAGSRRPAVLILAERPRPEVRLVEALALREGLARATALDHGGIPWHGARDPIPVCVADSRMITEFQIPDSRAGGCPP